MEYSAVITDFPTVPYYISIQIIISLFLSIILPLFLILYTVIIAKASLGALLAGLFQYAFTAFMMCFAVALIVILTQKDLADKTVIYPLMFTIAPIFFGLFLPAATYIMQFLLTSTGVKKVADLDRKYWGRSADSALWGGILVVGDFSINIPKSKRWSSYIMSASFFAFLNNTIMYSFSPATDLFIAFTRGGQSGGRLLTQDEYAVFYQNIINNAARPGIDFLFNFALAFLFILLAFKLGKLERFKPMLLLMPVCVGLKYLSYILSPHPLYFALFTGIFILFAVVMSPLIMSAHFKYK